MHVPSGQYMGSLGRKAPSFGQRRGVPSDVAALASVRGLRGLSGPGLGGFWEDFTGTAEDVCKYQGTVEGGAELTYKYADGDAARTAWDVKRGADTAGAVCDAIDSASGAGSGATTSGDGGTTTVYRRKYVTSPDSKTSSGGGDASKALPLVAGLVGVIVGAAIGMRVG